jgi:hypothetical protein
VLRNTAKDTFCSTDILDETDTLAFGVVKLDLMSSLKTEAARFAVKLAPKGRYILEDWTDHVFTLRFGISRDKSALKIVVFIVTFRAISNVN